MFKFTILAIFLAIASASASLEKFVGDWTPVAMYPAAKDDAKECPSASLSATNNKCACEDGKIVQILEVSPEKQYRKSDEKIPFPVIVVDDFADVPSALNATCSCENGVLKRFPYRAVVRSVNSNYFIVYKYLKENGNDAIGALLIAREIRSEEKLLDDIKEIDDLRDRDGSVVCTSEVLGSGVHGPRPVYQKFFV